MISFLLFINSQLSAQATNGLIAPAEILIATAEYGSSGNGTYQSVYPFYTDLPSGPTPVLMLNQPIGISTWLQAAQCASPDFCPLPPGQFNNGWLSGNYAFKAIWSGGPSGGPTQVNTFTNSGYGNCVPWFSYANLTETGYFSTFAWFSTPGTKTVTISATPCGSFSYAMPASATFTFTIGAALYDPMGAVVQTSGLTIPSISLASQDADTLVQAGRPIQGVAADGASLALLKIPATNVGDSFTVTLLNDQGTASLTPYEDGALGVPGPSAYGGAYTQNTVTVVAQNTTDYGPYAFALYQPPPDFVRTTENAPGSGPFKTGTCAAQSATDDQLPCRGVTLQIVTTPAGGGQGSTINLPVTIVRPPVTLIHGLWGSWSDWNNFSPLVLDAAHVDSRFYVGRVSYDNPIGTSITSSVPIYSPSVLAKAQENALGFDYNAPRILDQIRTLINDFKLGNNPLSMPVAAIQTDIVAHSMGGVLSRYMVQLPNFYNPGDNLNYGRIHKLITIDSPHTGSPLANQLLNPAEFASDGQTAGCMQDFLGNFSSVTFQTAVVNGQSTNGAVLDMELNSHALSLIASSQSGTSPIPTALIGSVYTNFSALNSCNLISNPIGCVVVSAIMAHCPDDPFVELYYNPTGWQQLFQNQPNDAIVSLASQLNNNASTSPYVFVNTGFAHSPGATQLGFSPPTAMSSGSSSPVPGQVINLLNTPVYYPYFLATNP